MNILVSCNDTYVMPLKVMLYSFFESNRSSSPHHIYMLQSDLSPQGNESVGSMVASLGGVYHSIDVDSGSYANADTRIHISKETYYRLLAARYLPVEVKRVLWLDADMIVRKPLDELYGVDLEGKWTAACGYGPVMQGLIHDNAVTIGLSDPDMYFNAGVMLYDLDKCRAADFTSMQEAFLSEGRKLLFPGQDLVNKLFDGHVKMMDYRIFNSMIHCIDGEDDLHYAQDHAAIVHFPGQAKPWKFNDIHFAAEWEAVFRRCLGDDAPLRRMSYFALQAMFNKVKKA